MNDPSFCPDPTVLAAFVDGRLSADARREVVLHLDRCELCYETVVETARFQSEEEPRGRVLDGGRFGIGRTWWLGAAAAAALVVAALLIWPVVRFDPERQIVATLPDVPAGTDPTAEVSPATLAIASEAPWPGWPGDAEGFGFARTAGAAPSFRLGVRLADLRLVSAGGDEEAYLRALAHLAAAVGSEDLSPALARALADAAEAAGDARDEAVAGLADVLRAEAELEALEHGVWAETSRLAAAADDHPYFASPAFARGLERYPPPEAREALEARVAALEAPADADAMAEVEAAFRHLVRDGPEGR